MSAGQRVIAGGEAGRRTNRAFAGLLEVPEYLTKKRVFAMLNAFLPGCS